MKIARACFAEHAASLAPVRDLFARDRQTIDVDQCTSPVLGSDSKRTRLAGSVPAASETRQVRLEESPRRTNALKVEPSRSHVEPCEIAELEEERRECDAWCRERLVTVQCHQPLRLDIMHTRARPHAQTR
jgi:hypothetical protein